MYSQMRSKYSIRKAILCFYGNIYRPQRSWGKVMFLQVSCDSVHVGGGYLTWSGGCVPDQVPLLPGTPPSDQVPPQDQVHPPGPGTPPRTRYTPRPGTPPHQTRYTPHQTRYTPPPDQVHPPDQVPPLDQVHPPDQVPPQDQVHPRTRSYGQRAGGTHPTGMQSCYH